MRGLGDQMKAICSQLVRSGGGGGAGTCVVAVEQQAVGVVVWTTCSPSLEDLGPANADVILCG